MVPVSASIVWSSTPQKLIFIFCQVYNYQQAHETVRHCFPGAAVVGNLPANAGDEGDSSSIPGSGRSPGVGNVNLLQYSCLGNPMDRGAWLAMVHGVTKESDTT